MRGKVVDDDYFRLHYGITPAYAGKSNVRSMTNHFEKDHPRLCGEKGAFPALSNRELGSPPPMRGKADYAGIDGVCQ